MIANDHVFVKTEWRPPEDGQAGDARSMFTVS
jgi:hypothetical protein